MADSNPIIVGGGVGTGAPFAVGHLVYVTNTSPPQLASYPPMRLLDGAVSYTSVPNSAGVFVTVAGAAETWRVKGGAIIEGPAVDSVQIGRNITGLVGADQVVIGRGAIGSNLPGGVCVGSVSNMAGGASVVIGRNSGSGPLAPVGGVFIGDTAQASGNGGGANVVVIGDSALIVLGGNPGGIGVAIGRLARVNHPSSVTIGDSAQSSLVTAAGQNTVTIGQSATSTKGGTVVLGGFATTVQTGSIVIGAQAAATGALKTRSIVIGQSSTVAGTDCISVGGASALTSDSCIAIGAAAVDLGAGVLQLGTNGTQITTTIIGLGNTIITPPPQLIRFTNGSGADNAAGTVTIQAALSTGNALPGTLVFAVGQQVAGSSAVVQTPGAGLTLSHTTAGGHNALFGGSVGIPGVVAIGAPLQAYMALYIAPTTLTGASQYGIDTAPVFSSAAVTAGGALVASVSTAAAAFTMANGFALLAGAPVVGVGSAITQLHGIRVQNQGAAGVTNAYGLYLEATAGASTINESFHNAGNSVLIGATQLGDPAATAVTTIGGGAYGAGVASLRMNGLTSGAGAGAGTVLNTPNAAGGNPAFWMPINIAGTVRYIPCWAA